jgi:ribosomal protein S6
MDLLKYELVLVLPGEATSAKKKSATETLEKIVKIFKGKVVKATDWGKRELAYKIKKNNSGVFMIFDLELSQSC